MKPIGRSTSAILFAFLAAAAGSFFPEDLRANDGSPVLIVNSDGAVERYSKVQAAFLETIDSPTVQMNLRGDDSAERELNQRVRSVDPEVIYCIGSRAFLAAVKVAQGRSIVLSSAINWERLPGVGPRTYGIATELPPGTQLTMFRYIFPDVRKIGVLYSREFNRESIQKAEAAGREVGIEVVGRSLRRAVAAGGLDELLREVDALWVIPDPTVLPDRKAIETLFERARVLRKPVFAYHSAFATEGATLTISADDATIGRQAAGLAEDLAHGHPLADRFQTPAGSEITIHMGQVRECGLKLNADALESVNRIIE